MTAYLLAASRPLRNDGGRRAAIGVELQAEADFSLGTVVSAQLDALAAPGA